MVTLLVTATAHQGLPGPILAHSVNADTDFVLERQLRQHLQGGGRGFESFSAHRQHRRAGDANGAGNREAKSRSPLASRWPGAMLVPEIVAVDRGEDDGRDGECAPRH